MSEGEIISLVDHLRAETAEKEWFEFKRAQVQPNERLGEYLSALANSAALAHRPYGYLILGVRNDTHEVKGTSFDYRTEKVKGNQDLWFWTTTKLNPPTAVDVYEAQHPDGRVVVFRVGASRDQPVEFDGVAYIRINSSNTRASNYPDKYRALWNLQMDWSAQVVPGATFADLDPEALAKARAEYAEKNPRKADALAGWDDVTFLNKARVTIRGQVTNAAILLLGLEESAALLSPAVAKLSWLLKDDENRDLDYEHFGPPFLLNVDALLALVRNLTIRTLPAGTLFPKEIQQYDDYVIREALHNAIAHQDYALRGRVQVVETPSACSSPTSGASSPAPSKRSSTRMLLRRSTATRSSPRRW